MAIRIRIRITLFCFVFLLLKINLAQTEEQKKYFIEKPDEFKSFIIASNEVGSMSTHFHTKSVYSDIYFDTPDYLLLKNNFSLRMRRRIFNNEKENTSYSFQLKSEMDSISTLRMEVEEKELLFYKVKSGSKWIPLPVLLDTIFFHFDNKPYAPFSEEVKKAIQLLKKWIKFKAGGAIAPFQKLLHFKTITEKQVTNLVPVTCGKSTRYRSHIYVDSLQNNNFNFEKNIIKRDRLPGLFKNKPKYTWLLESSFDVAVFYPLIKTDLKEVKITEYEVESKHYLPKIGTKALLIYEIELKKQFKLVSKLDSKYKQVITKLMSK